MGSLSCDDGCLALLCFIPMGVGSLILRRSRRFRREGIETVGEVVRIRELGTGDDKAYRATVKYFNMFTGQEMEFEEPTATYPSQFRIGQQVRIRYLPTPPYEAVSIYWLNLEIVGALMILVGIGLLGFLVAQLFFGYQPPQQPGLPDLDLGLSLLTRSLVISTLPNKALQTAWK
jgi:hypothetical protein